MVISKPAIISLGTALALSMAAAGYFYYQNASTSRENARLSQSLSQSNQIVEDLEQERFRLRQSEQLNRELHERLQRRYEQIRQRERDLESQLTELQEDDDAAQRYFDECPMPDSVFDWVLQH